MSLRRSCALTAVLDSDTLRLDIDGQAALVRLMDVHPPRARAGGSQPATAAGRRTLRWLREVVFKGVEEVQIESYPDAPPVSNSGKRLAHVFVRGEHLNERMVREGFSPYFQKYGHSLQHHHALQSAELWARFEGAGIWSELGSAAHYGALKRYWEMRAGQVNGFRIARHLGEEILGARSHYDDILERARANAHVILFAEAARAYHLADGSMLLQLGGPQQALSAVFPPRAHAIGAFVEREFVGDGKLNYLYFSGRMHLADGQPQIVIDGLEQISTTPLKSA